MGKKPLSEMSLQELWQLFPIILREHDAAYAEWYAEAQASLMASLPTRAIARLNHIGSTAVAGLVAKPTVDILLELVAGVSIAPIINALTQTGWREMSIVYEPQLKLVFNKGYTPDGFADKVYHLHVRILGDWDELYFRDYLQVHPEVAEAYGQLKRGLFQRFEHDRDGYTEAKTTFIKEQTTAARSEFPRRYMPV